MVTMSNRDTVIVPCQSCGASVSKYAMSCPYCEALLAGKGARPTNSTAESKDQAPARRGTRPQTDCSDKAA
jgi:hypothetical protein